MRTGNVAMHILGAAILLAIAGAAIMAGSSLAANKDLIVSVTASPNAVDNTTVDFNITAANTGNSTAGPATVQLYIDGVASGPVLDYGNIGANQSEWQLENFTMLCGWHTVNATVDPSDVVPEDNETNNNYTFQLKVAPFVGFTWSLDGPLGDYNLTLNATQSHGCAPLAFSWELEGVVKTGAEVVYNPPAGTLPLSLTATPADATLAGAVSTTVLVPNLGPSLLISVPNATLRTLTPLQLSIDAIDMDGAVASYFVDFGDGNTTTVLGAGAAYVYHTSGSFTVTVRVADNLNATNQSTLSVTVQNQAPTVMLEDEFLAANVGQSVEFNASRSSDPEGGGLTYSWDFGDGSAGTGPVANHSYAKPGSYKVNLTVTDATGATTTTSATVTVVGGGGPTGGDVLLTSLLILLILIALGLILYFAFGRKKDEKPAAPPPGEGSLGKPPSG